MPENAQIPTKLWTEDWFLELSPEAKNVYFALRSAAACTTSGMFTFSTRTIASNIGFDRATAEAGMAELVASGHVQHDPKCSLVWMVDVAAQWGAGEWRKIGPRQRKEVNALGAHPFVERFRALYPQVFADAAPAAPAGGTERDIPVDIPDRPVASEPASPERDISRDIPSVAAVQDETAPKCSSEGAGASDGYPIDGASIGYPKSEREREGKENLIEDRIDPDRPSLPLEGDDPIDRSDEDGASACGGGDPEAVRLWSAVLDVLALKLTRPNFDTWLRPLRARAFAAEAGEGGVLTVEAPSMYSVDWLRTRMVGEMERAASKLVGTPVAVRVVVAGAVAAAPSLDAGRAPETVPTPLGAAAGGVSPSVETMRAVAALLGYRADSDKVHAMFAGELDWCVGATEDDWQELLRRAAWPTSSGGPRRRGRDGSVKEGWVRKVLPGIVAERVESAAEVGVA